MEGGREGGREGEEREEERIREVEKWRGMEGSQGEEG